MEERRRFEERNIAGAFSASKTKMLVFSGQKGGGMDGFDDFLN